MNTITKNILALMAFALVGTSAATAQTTFPKLKIGDNPRTLDVNAVLELESANKGFLLPRVELSATNSAAPLTGHVAGMTVYNTATTGTAPNNVTPGYYYNDGTQWVRVATGADAKTEPWFDQATNTEATTNTQSIYQLGDVAIGKDASITGAALDIEGAVRGGTGHLGVVGVNSLAIGDENQASGANSIALGIGNVASGENSVSLGVFGEALGEASVALGGTASGTSSFATQRGTAIGSNSIALMGTANSYSSFAVGRGATAYSYMEIALGSQNAITNGNPASWIQSDALFQLGNGEFLTEYSGNALTVLKNGNTAIGVSGMDNAAKPTERLDIGLGGPDADNKGSIRIRAINTPQYTSDVATDRVIVANADGVLKSVERSALAPEYVEPWQIIGGTNKATANTDHIYQMGRIAIGTNTIPDITVGASTITPQLHVAGDISTTGKFWTTNSVYADYVFEKYFKGSSDINPNYEFKSLNYVKDFIKANHHLPGVESIDDLNKVENGYTFDITKLTVQSLEKIEELYLHTIEQQDMLDQQQSEIEKLKKDAEETKARLEKLEKLLEK